MSLAITILGCGSSGGVPRLAGGWGDCDPSNPKNRRRRCSILVERGDMAGARTTILVDTSPDLREQLLGQGIDRLDGILVTHPHADHINGMDDVRPLVIHNRKRIDIHMDAGTSATVTAAFGYIFRTPDGSLYPALLNESRLADGQICEISGPGGMVSALPFRLNHGEIDALGFRFGDIAYTPDFKAIPEESLAALEHLDIWIIDALRHQQHPSHVSLSESLAWIARMKPRRAVLTNMHTDLDYETLRGTLPANVEPAFDGMRIEGGDFDGMGIGETMHV